MAKKERGATYPSIVFPFHMGPGVRSFTTPLLYGGGLVTTLPGYTSGQPERLLFGALYDRAEARNHPLLPFLRGVVHHVRLAQNQALSEIEALKPLGRRVKRIVAVYPGTREQYAFWDPLHADCLALAVASLSNVQALNAASVEFMWRAYEHSLELGGDIDAVLAEFTKRTERLGSVDLLLAECALNRHFLVAGAQGHMATTIPETIAILSKMAPHLSTRLGRPIDPEGDPSPGLAAFVLFDELLARHVPPLHGRNVERVAGLLEDRRDELLRMRERCQDEAVRLIQCSPDVQAARAAFQGAVAALEEEVAALLQTSRRQTKDLIRAITESDSAWLAIAGALGSAFGSSRLAAASWAMGALAVLGASAVRVKREAQSKIDASPWSFVYYLRNR